MTILEERIKSVYTNLTREERKAADYSLRNDASIFNKTVAELAEASGTTQATWSRFAKSLGYTGLKGTFGGDVDVEAIENHETYFYIRMHALGKEACRSLATSDWGADGLVSVSIAADDPEATAPGHDCTTSGDGKFCPSDLPVKLGDLGTTSDDLCGSETNMITWVYY